MTNAKRDENHVTSMLGVSSADSTVTVPVQINPLTGRMKVDITGGGGGGAVDSVNGETGTVVLDTDDISEGDNKYVTQAEKDKLAGITPGADMLKADNLSGLADNETARTNIDVYSKEESDFNTIAKLGTHVAYGVEITATLGGTTFDVSSGLVYVVDNYTDPANPSVTKIEYAGSTGNTITNLATAPVTYTSMNSSGVIVQHTTNTWGVTDRETARFGTIVHLNLSTINSFDSVTHGVGFDMVASNADITRAIGIMIENNTDFAFSAASNDMTIARSSGTALGDGINRTNRVDPNALEVSAVSPVTNFLTSWQDGAGGFTLNGVNSVVTAGVYDDGTGGVGVPNGTVANNRWVNHRFYFSPDTGLMGLAYGQSLHFTEQDALNSLQTESNNLNPLLNGLLFRGWLTIKGNASDLSDTTQAAFTTATKFGATGGASVTSAVTGQDVYENSTQPQVITDSTRGAVQTQRGSASDADNIIEGLNGAGTVTTSIRGDGGVVNPTDLVTKEYGDANYGGGGGVNNQTGISYTLVLGDVNKLVTLTNISSIALTIPTNATVSFPIGSQIDISQDGLGPVTVGGVGVTINSLDGNKTTNGQYIGATLIKVDTDSWNLYGNLTT